MRQSSLILWHFSQSGELCLEILRNLLGEKCSLCTTLNWIKVCMAFMELLWTFLIFLQPWVTLWLWYIIACIIWLSFRDDITHSRHLNEVQAGLGPGPLRWGTVHQTPRVPADGRRADQVWRFNLLLLSMVGQLPATTRSSLSVGSHSPELMFPVCMSCHVRVWKPMQHPWDHYIQYVSLWRTGIHLKGDVIMSSMQFFWNCLGVGDVSILSFSVTASPALGVARVMESITGWRQGTSWTSRQFIMGQNRGPAIHTHTHGQFRAAN